MTASKDGDVKTWDGVSNRCINTFQRAHDGAEVCSAVFTRNGKVWRICTCKRFHGNSVLRLQYVLTSGKDSVIKLWELATNRCLIAYTGAGVAGQQQPQHRVPAAFNQTEDYGNVFVLMSIWNINHILLLLVLYPDQHSGSLCSWDSRNCDRKRLLALGIFL